MITSDELSVAFNTVRRMLSEISNLDELMALLRILQQDFDRRLRADRFRVFQIPGPVTAVWEGDACCWRLTYCVDGKPIRLVGEDGLGVDRWPWRGEKVVPTDGRDWYWWDGRMSGLPVGPYKTEQEAHDAADEAADIPF
jgi:hypothetical protein